LGIHPGQVFIAVAVEVSNAETEHISKCPVDQAWPRCECAVAFAQKDVDRSSVDRTYGNVRYAIAIEIRRDHIDRKITGRDARSYVESAVAFTK
jgi:hypothetical protein